jgi:hypothetical protein
MDNKLKTSYRQEPMPPRYADLIREVAPLARDTAFRWSRRGVPHLLVETARTVYSLCYFEGRDFWRVFHPYGRGNQRKWDFGSVEEVIKFLAKRKTEEETK